MNFIKKHKKFVIITSIIFVVLLTAIILIFTLFSLKTVTLNFKTETDVLTEELQQEIVAEVENKGVSTVLFANKTMIKNDLERKFPYLKVVNIETIFPSSFVIHCVEREELYAIESDDKVYYLDEDMKVLKVEEDIFVKNETNAVLLDIEELNLNLETLDDGQFLTVGSFTNESEADILANKTQLTLTYLLTAFKSNNRDLAIVRANYQKFKIEYRLAGEEWVICLSLTDNLDFETIIEGADVNLSSKINIMINAIDDFASSEPEIFLSNKLVVSISGLAYLISK